MIDPTLHLKTALAAYELYPDVILWDGIMRRFAAAGKKKKDAWLICFPDQRGAVFGDWSTGLKVNWRSRAYDQASAEDRRRWAIENEKNRKKRLADKESKEAKAAEQCREVWAAATRATKDHPYLVEKKVTRPLGIRQHAAGVPHYLDPGSLIVPMYAVENNQLVGLQRIQGTTKLNWPNARAYGVRMAIGAKGLKTDPRLIICEGYVTGLAIHKATRCAVVVAFNKDGLLPVGRAMREKYPDAQIIIAADNDRWTHVQRSQDEKEPNPGVVYALEAAREIEGVQVAIPDFQNVEDKPTDFHDLLMLEGEGAVRHWLDPQVSHLAQTVPDEEPPPIEDGDGPGDVPDESWIETAPFRMLGVSGDNYFYLPRSAGFISIIPTAQHALKIKLCRLAPLPWWQHAFPAGSRDGVNWLVAGDALLQAQHEVGVYEPARLRGRGCWPQEGGGVILHLGDRLLPQGSKQWMEPAKYTGDDCQYEKLAPLAGPSSDRAMELDEAREILDLFVDLKWEDPLDGILAAGWTVLAPFCGALPWRPHMWVVGGSGSGKSRVADDLIHPLLGGMVQSFDGAATTEAGIRQSLRADALPIMYEEAERSNPRATAMIDGVLRLMRSASSSRAKSAKGTTSGEAMTFEMRSMFCLNAIGGGVDERADATRVTVVQLKSAQVVGEVERQRHWKEYEPRLAKVNQERGRQLLARTMRWFRTGEMELLIRNCRTAATMVFGEARPGDQIGTLIAGAWTLFSDEVPEVGRVREWLTALDAEEKIEQHVSEGFEVLEILFQARENSRHGKMVAIGQVIMAAMADDFVSDEELRKRPPYMDRMDSEDMLLQFGIKVSRKNRALYLSTSSHWIKRQLERSTYSVGWVNALKTIPGVRHGRTLRFVAGQRKRIVEIPFAAFGEDDE